MKLGLKLKLSFYHDMFYNLILLESIENKYILQHFNFNILFYYYG